MPNEIYQGLAGNIKTGTTTKTTIAHMSGWNLDMSRDMVEIVSFGATGKEKVPGIGDWTADCDGTADFSTGGGQDALMTAYLAGTALTFGFYLSATKYFEGIAFIESLAISQDAEKVADIKIKVTGSGGIVLTAGV